MNEYIGETIVDIDNSPYKGYTKEQWVMEYIERYGQIDGGHHKQWVLDQISRIIKNTPIIITLRKWTHEEEYSFDTGTPSQEYLDWVSQMRGEDKEDEEEKEWYSYDQGIAP
jgi:hypothetical protein